MHLWHVRTTSSSVHWSRKEKYGCAAKPTMFVPGWRLCKQNTYLSNAVYGSDIWNFSGLTLGLFSHNRICPRMHPSCPPLPRHLPPCILSSPLCNVHTAFIPRTQDPGPGPWFQVHLADSLQSLSILPAWCFLLITIIFIIFLTAVHTE